MNDDNDLELEQNFDDFIEPEFIIDEDENSPRVVCEKHSEILTIIALRKKALVNSPKPEDIYKYEKMLDCHKCSHYGLDNCYFPKAEIDKIEMDRISNEIKCKLCGNKIDRPHTILYSLYNKEKFGIDIPIICCACYISLNSGNFEKNTQKLIFYFVISLFLSAYFLIQYFLAIFIFSVWGILILIMPLVFWGYILNRDMKKIYYLLRGRKYWMELFNPQQSENNFKDDEREKEETDEDFFEYGDR